VDYLATFATRVRRLRETAGLTIQEACDRCTMKVNTWSKIERGEQEPCLLVICDIAEGLGISPDVLMTLKERADNSARTQINDVLDLCRPDEWDLTLGIVKAIQTQRSATSRSSDKIEHSVSNSIERFLPCKTHYWLCDCARLLVIV
jgi:transcriptional regulator with XRE-family HTH domain